MRLILIIPTVSRRDVVARSVARLARQSRQPDVVIVSTTDEKFVPEDWRATSEDPHPAPFGFPIFCLLGKAGCCAQRNLALDVAFGRVAAAISPTVLSNGIDAGDVISFIDDDFLPADDYFEIVERELREHADWAVLCGSVPFDGVRNEGYDFEQGERLLATIVRERPRRLTDFVGAYGCNMSIRAGVIGDTRFDERLPLYAWQEDIDFTSRLRIHGRVVGNTDLVGVHLGTKVGRTKGVRFGYSQIANPLYLIRKGTMPAAFGIELMVRNFAANVARSLWSESYVDRRGRLYGNFVALIHAATGRLKPEYILEL